MALPRLDLLVNNAGVHRPTPIAEVTEDDFDAVAGLQPTWWFFVAQADAVKMTGQGTGGAIINMSSQMGHVRAPNRTLYCAPKHGL